MKRLLACLLLVVGCLSTTGPRVDLSGTWHYHVAYLGQTIAADIVLSMAQHGDSLYTDVGVGYIRGDSVVINDDVDLLHWHGIILNDGAQMRGRFTTYDTPPIDFVGLDWFATKRP